MSHNLQIKNYHDKWNKFSFFLVDKWNKFSAPSTSQYFRSYTIGRINLCNSLEQLITRWGRLGEREGAHGDGIFLLFYTLALLALLVLCKKRCAGHLCLLAAAAADCSGHGGGGWRRRQAGSNVGRFEADKREGPLAQNYIRWASPSSCVLSMMGRRLSPAHVELKGAQARLLLK